MQQQIKMGKYQNKGSERKKADNRHLHIHKGQLDTLTNQQIEVSCAKHNNQHIGTCRNKGCMLHCKAL